jgi:hypothetical protein
VYEQEYKREASYHLSEKSNKATACLAVSKYDAAFSYNI